MGHMDDDNEQRFTVTVRFHHGDAASEIFNSVTHIDTNDDGLEFTDKNGKVHTFEGVDYHIAEE